MTKEEIFLDCIKNPDNIVAYQLAGKLDYKEFAFELFNSSQDANIIKIINEYAHILDFTDVVLFEYTCPESLIKLEELIGNNIEKYKKEITLVLWDIWWRGMYNNEESYLNYIKTHQHLVDIEDLIKMCETYVEDYKLDINSGLDKELIDSNKQLLEMYESIKK